MYSTSLNSPKAEEVSNFFLARVVSNVLDLDSVKLVPRACRKSRERVHGLQWTTWSVGDLLVS